MKSRVTKYTDYCLCCGNRATTMHHLIFGTSGRQFGEKYGLIIPLCDSCHNMSEYVTCRIHDNPRAEDLSKMLGQAIWEKNYYMDLYNNLNRTDEDEARQRFIEMHGQSYL